MKAMILAAGIGTRLKPLTDEIPKALVPLNGTPMLEHVILKLKNSGFDKIIINVHHFSQHIIDFLKANENFGVQIKISDESGYLLDTGGGIKNVAGFFKGREPFLAHNVDIVSDVDLTAMYDAHVKNDPLATLLVSQRDTSRFLLFNDENSLCGWRNRETGEVKSFYPDFNPKKYQELAFGGIHVLSPKIFEWMDEWTGKFSIMDFYLSVCVKTNIQAYQVENLNFFDAGKPETLAKAEAWLLK
jgi:Nucleoside-diphosphate-sugar pyrophosphorylase involved in lipopolysaccharide biosynthesis/translation initiation factor 2B, gamma/epsilon subunits (eIF-2Bgamma/eIF-2Bepsilon)